LAASLTPVADKPGMLETPEEAAADGNPVPS
jgi:hypothetical protein